MRAHIFLTLTSRLLKTFFSPRLQTAGQKPLVRAVITARFSGHDVQKKRKNVKVHTINQKSGYFVYCGYASIREEATMLQSLSVRLEPRLSLSRTFYWGCFFNVIISDNRNFAWEEVRALHTGQF